MNQYDYITSLTKDQLILSKKLVHNFQSGINSLVNAVCGAGKTEIVLEVIKYAIEKRLKVGFAVPRVDVVKELYIRFKEIFKKNSNISSLLLSEIYHSQ